MKENALKKTVKLTLLVLLFTASSYAGFAQSISSQELIKNSKQYDGKQVSFRGEAVGDLMHRGDFAWVNISDGQNTIGVWMPSSYAAKITRLGGYKTAGDEIEVTGIFYRACPMHGGDLDIHAQAVNKITPGRILADRLNLSKRNQAAILLAILGLVWILSLLKRN